MHKVKSAGGKESTAPASRFGSQDISADILESLQTFAEIGESLRGTANPTEICEQVVEVLNDRLGLQTCSIMLVDADDMLVNVAGTSPRKGKAAPKTHRSFRLGEGVAGTVAKSGMPILIPDASQDERFSSGATAPTVRSLLCLPIKGAEGPLGVLNLSHGTPGFFGNHHVTVFGTLATILGRLLTEARLVQKLAGFNRELEQQVAERTLEIQASHSYLEQLLNRASDVILTVDWRGRVTFANPRVSVLGYEREALLGQPFSVLSPDGNLPTPLMDAMTGTVRHHEELVLSGRDGETLNTYCSFSPLDDTDGTGRGALVMIRDVTGNKRLELQVRQMEKLTAIGTLVAGIAHEINNKLVPILVYSELLQRAELPEKELKLIQTVHKSAVNARHIMDSLLRFSRQEAPRKEMCSLNEVVQDVINMVQFRTRKQDVTLECQLDTHIPALCLDAHQIAQVILNIVNNACDAVEGEAGSVEVRTELKGDEVRITIHDNGPGIDKENLARIFDPFFTTKEVGKGTGLGLSLCYGIVQEHSGDIQVHSTPGDTRFRISLPADSRLETPATGTAGDSREEDATPRGRCLVADGDPTLLEVLEHALAGHHDVVPEASGSGVISRLADGGFDVLLLDMNLSDMPGEDVLEWISEHRPHMAQRVVLMTGSAEELERLTERKLTSGPVITKPFQLSEVHRAVAGMLTIDKT